MEVYDESNVVKSFDEYCRLFLAEVKKQKFDENSLLSIANDFKTPHAVCALLYIRSHLNKLSHETDREVNLNGSSDLFTVVNNAISNGNEQLNCLRFITMHHAVNNCSHDLAYEIIWRCTFPEDSRVNHYFDDQVTSVISNVINQSVIILRPQHGEASDEGSQPNQPLQLRQFGDRFWPTHLPCEGIIGKGVEIGNKRNSDDFDNLPTKKHKSEGERDHFDEQTQGMKGFPANKPVIFYKKVSKEQPYDQWPSLEDQANNRVTYSTVYDIVSRPNEDTSLEAYTTAISDFYAHVFRKLLVNAGDQDYVGLSVEHANFQAGNSSVNPKKHHQPAFFVNKQSKSLIRWSEFTDALEKVTQSNADFVLDGQMTIRLFVTKPKSSGGKCQAVNDESTGSDEESNESETQDEAMSNQATESDNLVNSNSIISETYNEDDRVYLEDPYLAHRLAEHYDTLRNYHTIKNEDESCGWLAFALGKFIADIRSKSTKYSRSAKHEIKKLTNPQNNYFHLRKYLKSLIGANTELNTEAPMTEADLAKLQKMFPDYKIIVYHRPLRRENVQLKMMFSDPKVKVSLEKKITLEFVRRETKNKLHSDGGHFNTIDPKHLHRYCPTRLTTRPRTFCFHCNKPQRQEHNCSMQSCQVCLKEPPCRPTHVLECDKCGLRPVSDTCFKNHRTSQCHKFVKCKSCNDSIPLRLYRRHVNSNCQQRCHQCFKDKDKYPHYCELEGKPIDLLKTQDAVTRIQITYDIECTINDTTNSGHTPYLLCAMLTCDSCYNIDLHSRNKVDCEICKQSALQDGRYSWLGPACVDDFYDFIKALSKRCSARKLDIYAHNARGYDAQYVMSTIYSDPETDLDKVTFVINGTKVLKIGVGDCIRFYDSVLIFQQSLSTLPKAFGFESLVKKGYSPLGLLLDSNKAHRKFSKPGVFPSKKYFFTKFMTEKHYHDFLKWYEECKEKFLKSNERYDFESELLDYCHDDCRVLMAAIQTFRNMFKKVTEVDPLTRNFTLASIALEHFLTTKKKEHVLGTTPARSYRPEAPEEKRLGDFSRQKSVAEVSILNLIAYESEGKSFCELAFGKTEGQCVWKTNYKLGNYYPDGYCQTHNSVIEYNGCYYHPHGADCNFMKKLNSPHDAERARKRIEKIKYYEDQGIHHYTLWECNYQEDPVLQNFLPENNVPQFLDERAQRIKKARNVGYLNVRDAMFGGRTMNFRHLVNCEESDERIWHSDIVSMYPYVLYSKEYPLEHPTVIEAPSTYDPSWFGFVKCRIECPLHLGIGILPYKHDKRLLFPLCHACVEENIDQPLHTPCTHYREDRTLEGTWTTIEVNKAIEYGYRVQQVYHVLNYEKKTRGMFNKYIELWFAIKLAASGCPPGVDADDQASRQHYIQEVRDSLGIELDDKILAAGANPGLRSIAKLMLNSLWGKFGQRTNMPNHRVFRTHDEYVRFRAADNFKITQETNLTRDMLLVVFEMEDSEEARLGKTSLATACFVTAHARLMLFDTMAKIGLDKQILFTDPDGVEHVDHIYNGKLLYTDTDSVFYVSKDRLVEHSTHFGDWTDETLTETGDPEARITKAVFLAPKFYSKWTQLGDKSIPPKVTIKAKGVTISRATSSFVTGDKMFEKVRSFLASDECKDDVKMKAPQLEFKCVTESSNPERKRYVKTTETTKEVNVTFGKRGLVKGVKGKEGFTEPIGHCGHNYRLSFTERNDRRKCKPYSRF